MTPKKEKPKLLYTTFLGLLVCKIMAKNTFINTRFWEDSYVSDLDPIEKLLFIYCLTNNRLTLCGVYEIPVKFMAVEVGIDKEMIIKIFNRFKDDKKIMYENGWLCVLNYSKYQQYNSSTIKIATSRELERVPSIFLSECKNLGYIVPDVDFVNDKINITRRQSIYIRDKAKCAYCEKTIKEDKDVEIDHIIPLSKGGADNYENTTLSCRKCNQEKFDRTPEEYKSISVIRGNYHTQKAQKDIENDVYLRDLFISTFPKSKYSQSTPKVLPMVMDMDMVREQDKDMVRERGAEKVNNYPEDFLDFYSKYPKKVGKKKSFEYWKKTTEKEKKSIMKDIPKRKSDRKWENGYIKDPERYLKDRQWEDEIIKEKAKEGILQAKEGKYDKYETN